MTAGLDQLTAVAAEVVALRTEVQGHASWAAAVGAEFEQEILTARREAQREADAYEPGPDGHRAEDELRQLTRTLGLPRDLITDEPPHQRVAPASLAEARHAWVLAHRSVFARLRSLEIDVRAWRKKLIRTRRNRPAVPPQLPADILLLQQLYSDAARVRRAHVDAAVALVSARRPAMHALVRQRERNVLEEVDRRVARLRALSGTVHDPVDPDPGAARAARGPVLVLGRADLATPGLPDPGPISVALDFPLANGAAVLGAGADRAWAVDLVRSMVLRLFASQPAGKLHLVAVDPVSLGRSVSEFRHLAEYDERLVDVRTWTSERDIEAKLDELTDHVQLVISRYLRGQFESIDQYNDHAGEVAEPYRVLVVFDYPEGFTDTAAKRLVSLVENGARCGVHVVVVVDGDREMPRDTPLARLLLQMPVLRRRSDGRLLVAGPGGAELDLAVEPVDPPELAFDADNRPLTPEAELLVSIGTRASETSEAVITLETLLPVVNRLLRSGRSPAVPESPAGHAYDVADPTTWWAADSTQQAAALLGRTGAQNVAALRFSSTDIAGGALVVGLPRSGKSTALHAAVLTLCLAYSPAELELYLVDSKHGVEFATYSTLPHARMVSVHSDREFSVAVLESIVGQIKDRAEEMKACGVANISEFRRVTGRGMARVVLVMDEFHELFEEDDALGRRAFAAFSDIVRQGPFAGVHLVVASQTLSSMPAMDRSTLDLLPMRVAFMCNEGDAETVMGPSNKETRALGKAGQGIYNPLRGAIGRTQPFQGLFVAGEDRERILRRLEQLAVERSFDGRPRVFDGHGSAPRLPLDTADGKLRLVLGQPFSLAPTAAVVLRAAPGNNVLVVCDSTSTVGRGVVHSALLAAAASDSTLVVVDFLGEDDEALPLVDVVAAAGGSYVRTNAALGALADLAKEVERRAAAGDYRSGRVLLCVVGLARARSFDGTATADSTYDVDSGEYVTGPPPPHLVLRQVLRDGPEVGVHTLLAVPTLAALGRRLGSDSLHDLDHRLWDRTASSEDGQTLASAFTPIRVEANQLVTVDHARGTRALVRAHPPLTDLEEIARG